MNRAWVAVPGVACVVTALMLARFAPAAGGPQGDSKRGSAHVTSCGACHGKQGEGNPSLGFPSLAGQTSEYLAAQLKSFADGSRKSGVMSMLAKSIDAQTQLDVAAYYAAVAPPDVQPTSVAADPKQYARGRLLVRVGDESKQLQACANCHGPDGAGERHATPYLAGQPAAYIESAVREWKSGSRSSGARLMAPVAERLNDADIAAVAAYLSNPDQGSKP